MFLIKEHPPHILMQIVPCTILVVLCILGGTLSVREFWAAKLRVKHTRIFQQRSRLEGCGVDVEHFRVMVCSCCSCCCCVVVVVLLCCLSVLKCVLERTVRSGHTHPSCRKKEEERAKRFENRSVRCFRFLMLQLGTCN
jgi:hypothetical protein